MRPPYVVCLYVPLAQLLNHFAQFSRNLVLALYHPPHHCTAYFLWSVITWWMHQFCEVGSRVRYFSQGIPKELPLLGFMENPYRQFLPTQGKAEYLIAA